MKALREKKKTMDDDEADSIEESLGGLEAEQAEVLARIEAKELALKKINNKPKPVKKVDGEKEIAMVDLEDGGSAEKSVEKQGTGKPQQGQRHRVFSSPPLPNRKRNKFKRQISFFE